MIMMVVRMIMMMMVIMVIVMSMKMVLMPTCKFLVLFLRMAMNTDSNSAWTVNNNVVMQWSSDYDDDYDCSGVEMRIMAKYDEYELPCLKFEMMTNGATCVLISKLTSG